MNSTPTRREMLALIGSGTAMALAGCNTTSSKIDDDPNTYDYQFVESNELARDLLAYAEEDITTQTTVAWTGTYIEEDDTGDELRRYVAHPADTQQTFDVIEEVDGPVYNALDDTLDDDTLDDDTHHDVPLQLYGFTDELEGETLDPEISDDERTYHTAVFVAEAAERLDTEGTASGQ